jgi:hypothetical protein
MLSIAWGVGDLNTLISTQTNTMSNNQDVRPLYAREALASELDTTVRERVLALRVDIAAEVESEETRWEIKSSCPKTGKEEFVLMCGRTEIRLECDDAALCRNALQTWPRPIQTQVKPRTTDAKTRSKNRKEKKRKE